MKLSVAAAGLMASLIASHCWLKRRIAAWSGVTVTARRWKSTFRSLASRDFALSKDGRPVLARYALDLSDPDLKKGKSLEAVLVRYAEDKRALVLYQFSRGLPLTVILMGAAR